MSMVTVSSKRNRVYPRAFDHDEAIRLHAEGWSVSALAEKYGVTPAAISRVVDPRARERMAANTREWRRKQREPCKGGCGTLVWAIKTRSGYCTRCDGALRASRRRPPRRAPLPQVRRVEAGRGLLHDGQEPRPPWP